MVGGVGGEVAFELFGEGTDLIVCEFVRLFMGETVEIIFGE